MIDIKDIKDSKFLKDYSNKELEELAKNIREFILKNVAQNGGHLSANLGIVDLTIALAKVFDFEKDIVLFDVGHQAYTYKILTGRANRFDTLRKKDGLSGFPSLKESALDRYETGHSSTSIGTGLGFAIARDLDEKHYDVISIIGDGSIGNGLAYEALNQIGDLQTKQIIILNDNQMSISKNVGALSNALDSIRGAKGYSQAKNRTKQILNKTHVGRFLAKIIDKFKRLLKKIYLRQSRIFSEFGIEYYGPINGHDYKEMIKYLTIAKNLDKPVILHVITQKGKGYKLAEEDEIGKYHGIGTFDLKTGQTPSNSLPTFSEIVSSYVYNYAKKNRDIICITPGMSYGSKLEIIKEKLPKQFIDVGIAEEHAVLLANGLALAHKKPFLFIYSSFLQRGYDEIIHDIARMNSQVFIGIDRAGFVPGDGASHQGLFDVPMMLSVPNMVVTAPMDAKEANDLIYTSLDYHGPFSMRFNKINLKYDYSKPEKLKIGSWSVLKEGSDGIIISYGDFVNKACHIAEALSLKNIKMMVVNARFLKPYDQELFRKILAMNKPIFVYEESMENGSLGSFLSKEASLYTQCFMLYCLGVKDAFGIQASREELIEYFQLDEKSVGHRIEEIINKNRD